MLDLDAIERHWATVGSSACPECQSEALVAELRAARAQRDENLANVRRIDDLRMAEIKRLNAELRAAREVVEAYELMPIVEGTCPVLEAWWNDEVLPARAAYDKVVG